MGSLRSGPEFRPKCELVTTFRHLRESAEEPGPGDPLNSTNAGEMFGETFTRIRQNPFSSLPNATLQTLAAVGHSRVMCACHIPVGGLATAYPDRLLLEEPHDGRGLV